MRLTREQLEQIIEAVFDRADYDIEINGYRDYDITGWVAKSYRGHLLTEIQEILGEDKADLQELFDLQTKFQKKVSDEASYGQVSPIQHVRLMFIGIITEACEALEETNWKPWKKGKAVDMLKFKKEIIDLWHFVINLTLDSGMDAEELVKRFKAKNKINNERQEEQY